MRYPAASLMRRCGVIAAISLVLAGPAAGATKLVVTGHGWGHGVGMSQWGAYGYARHGWSFERILGHYYSGMTLADAPVSHVRVLLATAQPRVPGAGAGTWKGGDATGRSYAL